MTSPQTTSSVCGLVCCPSAPRHRRVTMLPGSVKPDAGHTLAEGTCALESCEALLRYRKLLIPGESLVEVACSIEHGKEAGWFPTETFKSSAPKEVKAKLESECSKCGGARRKKSRLFDHEVDCLDSDETKAAARLAARGVCRHCGGPPASRAGFVHTDECSRGKPVVVVRPVCVHCGGPARGIGWIHTEDCARPRPVVKAKKDAKPKLVRPVCEVCGGLASGRGWIHVEGCSKVKVYVPTGRPRGRRRRKRPGGAK